VIVVDATAALLPKLLTAGLAPTGLVVESSAGGKYLRKHQNFLGQYA
jgi:hypothetical protein